MFAVLLASIDGASTFTEPLSTPAGKLLAEQEEPAFEKWRSKFKSPLCFQLK